MNILNRLKKDFNESSDLIIKQLNNIYLIYLESICDSDKINFYILQNISKNKISGPNTVILKKYDDIKFYLEVKKDQG